jgi:hypothetical protein
MADRHQAERVAHEIIDAVSREFPGASLDLDFETARADHEDALLWITPGTEDRDDINEMWGYAIKLVQDAFRNDDVYLRARMRGVGIIDRERPADAGF